MDCAEDCDIESDDDIGEGFGAQAGEIPEVRTAETKTLTPSEADKGKRLDAYIGEVTDLSRSYAQNLIEDGLVSVSGKKVAKKYKIKAGETIIYPFQRRKPIDAAPEDIPINIIYEDEDVIVVENARHGCASGYRKSQWHARQCYNGITVEIRSRPLMEQ